jgi:hypothetical protein
LTVAASGQATTVAGVSPDELAGGIARLIQVVSKAARNGDLTKNRQRDSHQYGLGAPRSNRDELRFTG